ncbi:single-stranded DNA-binding protein [Carnobacterium maltaromaticum]|uniref:single-stranded DNA-binding protein n=1 Tax=Carnobacterium maltaromaticum TaxID=2751 RepID=UPI0039B07413
MNSIIISGTVTSEVKVINTNSGTPFCRFTIESDGRKFNCLVTSNKAYDFLYEVERDTQLTIDARINDKMQLVESLIVLLLILNQATSENYSIIAADNCLTKKYIVFKI